MLDVILYIVFVISAIVLIVVILLQEGRGGGFGQALGEHAQQTFGVGAQGINRFTFYTAGVFILSAIALHYHNRHLIQRSVLSEISPADPTQGVGAPPPAPGNPEKK